MWIVIRTTTSTLLLALSCLIGVCRGQASITIGPSNSTVLVGSNATFSCEVTGTQGAGESVTWRKASGANSEFLGSDSNPSNTTKHAITGKYNFFILDVTVADESEYQCSLFPDTYSAYISVNDPPSSASLLWPDNRTFAEIGTAANLTCSAELSRPPATFRWFKGNTEVTNTAVHPATTTDNNGYGTSYSTLEQTPLFSERGTVYRCLVDVPAQAGVIEQTLTLSFSGARHVVASAALIVAGALFSALN